MKSLLLATVCVMLYAVAAHPHTRRTSRFRNSHSTFCALLDIITCNHDLCMNSQCYYYPEAICRIIPLDCGCRAGWFTTYGEVDCNIPSPIRRYQQISPFQKYLQDQFRMRTGLGVQSPTQNYNPPPSTGVQGPVDPHFVPVATQGPLDPMPIPAGTAMDVTQVDTGLTGTAQTEACPHNVLRVECRENPCWVAQEIPGAVCSPNFCGGCIADFYRNGMKVICDRCDFPHLIVPASVIVSDHSAYLNTHRPVEPQVVTNTAPWTEAGPAVPIETVLPQIVNSGPSTQGISNHGISQTGSSVLSLQGNIGSVSGLFPIDPLNSPVDTPLTAVNDLSKTSSVISESTWFTPEAFVVDPSAVCPPDQSIAKCMTDPCLGQTCARYPSAVCRVSPCGNCQAKWFVNETEVDCEICDSNTFVTSCPMNPCDLYSCPRYPSAECRMTKCGSCKDHWFYNGSEVVCDIPWTERQCTPQEDLECKERCSYHHCPGDYSALCRVKGCGSSCQLEYYKVVDNMFTPVSCQIKGQWTDLTG